MSISIALFLAYLLATGYIVGVTSQEIERSDNVEGYEKNELLTGLDIYINESSSPVQPGLSLNELSEINENGWKIQRYFLLPASVNLDDWTIYDQNTIFVIGGWGGQAGPDIEHQKFSIFDYQLPNFVSTVSAQSEIKTETGITSYTGRTVDGVTNIDANEEIGQSDTVTIDTDFTSFNATTSVGAVTANYTVPDNKIDSGIHYTAGDSKSFVDYSKELALANGKTYYGVINGSMVGFAYDNFGDLEAVVLTMDEESTSAPGQEGFTIRRARVWLKSKKQSVKAWGSRRVASIDKNVFSPIKNIPKTLAGVPNKAKQFFTKNINPGHYLATKLGLSGMTSTIVKRVGALIGIILFILTLVGIVWLIRNRGKLMKR